MPVRRLGFRKVRLQTPLHGPGAESPPPLEAWGSWAYATVRAGVSIAEHQAATNQDCGASGSHQSGPIRHDEGQPPIRTHSP
jgi:hypothetical protein